MVGRDAELDELAGHWHDARDGRRRIAMLIGEPGIGKTRLAAEFCRTAHADGSAVLLGRCYEESLVPYQPFVEALSHYVAESPARRAAPASRATPRNAGEARTRARRTGSAAVDQLEHRVPGARAVPAVRRGRVAVARGR